MRALSAIVLGLAAVGCHHLDPGRAGGDGDGDAPGGAGSIEGVACSGDTRSQQAVYIQLDYAADAATMPPCEVDRYTRITWRAPRGEGGFRLEFDGAAPAGPEAPSEYVSRAEDGVHRVALEADAEPGEYRYQILVDRVPVDPVIIIRR